MPATQARAIARPSPRHPPNLLIRKRLRASDPSKGTAVTAPATPNVYRDAPRVFCR
jgi:hypothetical protein